MLKRLQTFLLFCIAILLSNCSLAQLNYYYGNLHAHSGYSDGNQDEATSGLSTPGQNFYYAKSSYHFDFLGISEHNHYQAGMKTPLDYHKGQFQADTANVNGTFVAMYGMEWGVISNGGHLLIYGYPNLIGWDTIPATNQPDYEVYCSKYNYDSLWKILAATPGVFASLAHPDTYDYDSLNQRSRNALYDGVIAGVAVRSGSATSTTTDYSDAPATSYLSYFRRALSLGYHVAPTIDHDNHRTTFGRISQTRTVILASALHRDTLMAALRQMHFYASDDWNARLSFTVNGAMMGSDFNAATDNQIAVSVSDVDAGDNVSKIEVFYGVPGSGTLPTVLTSNNNSSSLTFTHTTTVGNAYYYYIRVTQVDGDLLISAPIWVNRVASLDVALTSFDGHAMEDGNELTWTTAREEKMQQYEVERSSDGNHFEQLGIVAAENKAGSAYTFTDRSPLHGANFYRLKLVEQNGGSGYSKIITLRNSADFFHLIALFPNPVSTELSLQYTTSQDRQAVLHIYDATGRLQQTNEVSLPYSAKMLTIPVTQLAAGRYYLTLTLPGEGRVAEQVFMKL